MAIQNQTNTTVPPVKSEANRPANKTLVKKKKKKSEHVPPG
jgi:hypothetical protein